MAGRAACVAALLALGCQRQPPDVLAVWRDGEARAADLEAFVRSLPPEERGPSGGQPVEEWVAAGLRRIATQDAIRRRAAEAGLAGDRDVVTRARYVASLEIGRRFVAERCPDEEIPEADLRRIYEQRSARGPRQWILVRHIYRRLDAGAATEERERVRRELSGVLAQLEGGASFVELARRHSESQTARDGGLIGRLSRDAPMEKEFLDAAWSLADGEHSGIVELPNGLHIILREDSGVEEPEPFATAVERLRSEVQLARREACGRRILLAVAAQRPVTLQETGLAPRPDPEAVLLRIGDEAFTVGELDGLLGEGEQLATSQHSLRLVQQFAEAVLLTAAARAESPELDALSVETEARLREQLAAEKQWRRERRAFVESRPEEELRRFFAENRTLFRGEPELDLGVAVLAVGPQVTPRQASAVAWEISRRARAGESFEDLARAHSAHSSREQGGRLGFLPWSRARALLGKGAAEALAELEVGEVSDPVLLTRQPVEAYGVIRVYGRREPVERTFEEARAEVIEELLERDVRELDEQVREQILAEIGFEIHRRGIESYLANLGRAPAS